MKQQNSRFLAILLSVAVLFSGLPVAMATDGESSEAAYVAIYHVSTGTVMTTTGGSKTGTYVATAATLTDGLLYTEATDVVAFKMRTEEGITTFQTPEGQYLAYDTGYLCFSDAQGENTAFVIEEVEDGYYIRLANYVHPYTGAALYLEVYAGNFTTYYYMADFHDCYLMNFYELTDEALCEHVYDSGVVTQEATCTCEGEITYTCTLCGKSRNEVLPVTAHDYIDGFCACGKELLYYRLTNRLVDGDRVILVNPSEQMAVGSAIDNTYYKAGVRVTIENGTVPLLNESIVWSVVADGEGFNLVNAEGNRLSVDGIYNSLNSLPYDMGNDAWTLTAAQTDGCVYLVNESGNRLSWTIYENFSSYTLDSAYNVETYLAMQIFSVPHIEHNQTVTVEPSCTQDGEMTYDCSVCGNTFTQPIAAMAHHYVDGVCADCGAQMGACPGNGIVASNVAVGDMIVIVASYTSEEVTAYYALSKDNTTLANAILAVGVEFDGEMLNIGESDVVWEVCAGSAENSYTLCASEGCYLSYAGSGTALTLSETGTDWYLTCGNNSSAIVPVSYEGQRSLAFRNNRNGTQFRAYADTTSSEEYSRILTICKNPNTYSAGEHLYTASAVTVPTCTRQGYTTYTCSACGEKCRDNSVEALGHGEYSAEVTAPTCTEQGYTTYTCTVCGESYTDDYVDVLGHGEYSAEVTAPTCTEQGYTTYTCTVCCEGYTDDYVDALGHRYREGVCTVCFDEWYEGVRQFRLVSELNEGDEILIVCGARNVALSGEFNGYYNKSVAVSPDEGVISSGDGSIVWTVGKQGDVYTFSYNGQLLSMEENYSNMALDSVHSTWSITEAATDGAFYLMNIGRKLRMEYYDVYDRWSCWRYAEKDEDLYALSFYVKCAENHSWTQVDGKAASCTEAGFVDYTCQYCNSTRYETLPMIDHSYELSASVAPNCEWTSVNVYFCTSCGANKTESVPATGVHTFEGSITTPATCTEDGIITYTCTDCGLTKTESIPAVGHSYRLYRNNGVNHTVKCTSCDDSYAEAHSYTDGVCVCGAVEVTGPTVDESIVINHTLNLASDISITFAVRATLLADYDSYSLECVIPVYEGDELTGSKTVTIEPVLNGSYYYFTLTGMTVVQMNDLLEATLHMTKDGAEYVSNVDTYSVSTYAYSQLNKTAATDTLKALCADLLRYGAAAQTYKGYRTDALVNADMTEEQIAYLSDIDSVTFGNNNTTLSDIETPSITWAGKVLNLDSKVELKFVMNTANYSGDLKDLSLHVSYNDYTGAVQTALLTEVEEYNTANNWYSFAFDGLLAAELRQVVSVAVYEGETQVSPTLQYSADTYGNNKTGTLLDLCKALFAYSDTALAYFS